MARLCWSLPLILKRIYFYKIIIVFDVSKIVQKHASSPFIITQSFQQFETVGNSENLSFNLRYIEIKRISALHDF
jgi:hypothetical protein